MTQEDVKKILGIPNIKSLYDNKEVWYYIKRCITSNHVGFLKLSFTDLIEAKSMPALFGPQSNFL